MENGGGSGVSGITAEDTDDDISRRQKP